MSTWRDIKKDPPKDMQAAIVTDGESVWAGFIRRYGKDYTDLDKIYATNLNDGSHDVLYLEDLTEWQPIQVDRVEKSADEMFADLGWELDMPLYNSLPCKYVNRHKWKIEFLHKDRTVEIGSIYGTFVLSEKTFLAIAQKIREMEANNG